MKDLRDLEGLKIPESSSAGLSSMRSPPAAFLAAFAARIFRRSASSRRLKTCDVNFESDVNFACGSPA